MLVICELVCTYNFYKFLFKFSSNGKLGHKNKSIRYLNLNSRFDPHVLHKLNHISMFILKHTPYLFLQINISQSPNIIKRTGQCKNI